MNPGKIEGNNSRIESRGLEEVTTLKKKWRETTRNTRISWLEEILKVALKDIYGTGQIEKYDLQLNGIHTSRLILYASLWVVISSSSISLWRAQNRMGWQQRSLYNCTRYIFCPKNHLAPKQILQHGLYCGHLSRLWCGQNCSLEHSTNAELFTALAGLPKFSARNPSVSKFEAEEVGFSTSSNLTGDEQDAAD